MSPEKKEETALAKATPVLTVAKAQKMMDATAEKVAEKFMQKMVPLEGNSITTLPSESELRFYGSMLTSAGLVRKEKTDGNDREVAINRAMAKVVWGLQLGFDPVSSQKLFHYFAHENSLGLSSEGMGARIKSSDRFDYRTVGEHTAERCELEFFENGKSVGTVEFTIEDAKKAGLVRSGGNWEKYPKDMLFWRCVSRGFRRHCSALNIMGLESGEKAEELVLEQEAESDTPPMQIEDKSDSPEEDFFDGNEESAIEADEVIEPEEQEVEPEQEEPEVETDDSQRADLVIAITDLWEGNKKELFAKTDGKTVEELTALYSELQDA